MANIQKQQNTKKQKPSVGKDVEKLESCALVGGNIKWYNQCGKQNGASPKKLKIGLLYDPAILLLGVYPKELRAGLQRDICTPCS